MLDRADQSDPLVPHVRKMLDDPRALQPLPRVARAGDSSGGSAAGSWNGPSGPGSRG